MWSEDSFADDDPDVAPAADGSRALKNVVDRRNVRLASSTPEVRYPDEQSGLTVEAPTEITVYAEDEAKSVISAHIAAVRAPFEPRIVRLTSCTQCVVANLPCSRTYPYCTRCKRKGQAHLCLLHRKRLEEEINRCDPLSCTESVMVKLKNEDESIWHQKDSLLNEVRGCLTKVSKHTYRLIA